MNLIVVRSKKGFEGHGLDDPAISDVNYYDNNTRAFPSFSGEDSQRTLSEYTIATDRPSSRGHRTPRSKRSRSLERPSSGSRARSAASHRDSDVYVTSAAYRPPSEMR